MRGLVTGSTGLVGEAIIAALDDAGAEVVGLSRGMATAGSPGEHLEIDLAGDDAAAAIAAATRPCEAIVHCAALVDPGAGEAELERPNRLATEHVIELARAWPASGLVFISGITVIGRPRFLPITEQHPVDPPTPYLASKLLGERLVAEAGAAAGLRASSLRVTAPVGPRMPRGRILPALVTAALRDEPLVLAGRGTRRQNYVDVRDVGAAAVRALESGAEGVFNVGGAESVSNRELAERCLAALGSAAPIEHCGEDPDDELSWEVSLDRAERELAWRPARSLNASIEAIAGAIAAG